MGSIIPRESLAQLSGQLRQQGKRIVTTNGVFDLLHIGHVKYLQWCRQQGDILIVGVNTDSSVKVNKGDKRPILPEHERAELVASLACVDYVHLFGEKTPEVWIPLVRPDVHIKGGDYTTDQSKEPAKSRIIEQQLVESLGGECLVAPKIEGVSTTHIIQKIAESHTDLHMEPANESISSPKKQPAVFLDRDGTIIHDKEYMHKVEDLEFIPGAVEALQKLSLSPYKIIILSNQSGIARQRFSEIEGGRFNQHFLSRLASQGVRVDGIYYCTHHPQGSHPTLGRNCTCRKPKPGMVFSALKDHNLALDGSFMVGDKTMDVRMGNNLGIPSVLVKTGKGGRDNEHPAKPDCVVEDLMGAVEWILRYQAPSSLEGNG